MQCICKAAVTAQSKKISKNVQYTYTDSCTEKRREEREEAQRRPPWWNSRLTNRAPSPPPATQRPGPSQSVEPTLSSSPASQRSRAPPVTPDGHIDSPAHQQSGADHEPMLGDDSQASVVSRLKHLQDTVNKLLAVTDSSARRSPDKPKARLPKALTVSHLTCTYLYKHSVTCINNYSVCLQYCSEWVQY